MQIHPRPEPADGPARSGPSASSGAAAARSAASDRPPVRVDVATETVGDVALVRVRLRSNVDTPLVIRVRNRLDGPVLPPRTEGVPAAGWDDEGFSGTLPPEAGFGLGYACPAPIGDADAAVAVDLRGPSPAEGAGEVEDCSTAVATAVRDLGRAAPPADAVPAASGELTSPTGAAPDDDPADSALPVPVSAWLDAVEADVERAERLTDASAAEAASMLEDCGGPDAIARLPDALAADTAALRAAADRIEALTSRSTAAAPEPVVEALVDGAAAISDRPADVAAADR